MGASDLQTYNVVIKGAFWRGVLAIIASFNRAFAELGVAMMLGANARNLTRLLTTAIALKTSKGEIALSTAINLARKSAR